MKAENQIIVNEKGNSWLGFHSSNVKLNKALDEILALSKSETYKTGEWANAFWILDFAGACAAAQSTLEVAMKYYSEDRILVHYQKNFVRNHYAAPSFVLLPSFLFLIPK